MAEMATLHAQLFSPWPVALPGVESGGVAWGDFDNDGDLDLLLAGETSTGQITHIYRNTNLGFTNLNAGLPGISSGAVAWGDYNGDGFLDLALTGASQTGLITSIFRNNGDAAFTDMNAGLTGVAGSRLAWVDFDNDGDLDLFFTGHTGSAFVTRIGRNQGADLFSEESLPNVAGATNAEVAWADYDEDADQDLLLAGFTGDTVSGQSSRLYRNTNGLFTNATNVALAPVSDGSAAWGDYDNDADLDLLIAGGSIIGSESIPGLRLYRNNDDGTFTLVDTIMTGAKDCSLAWGDFDNDGDLDVAVAGLDANLQPATAVYANQGAGFFVGVVTGLPGVRNASLAWGDVDNDGDLDLALAGNDGVTNITRLFRNEVFAGNFPPLPPFNLASLVSGKSVTLSWTPGADPNQFGGFSYNVRVGSSPGADHAFASMANAATGKRLIPQLGNVSQKLGWRLRLPVGTYNWTVQTIDHALLGSQFETEHTFQILPQAPEIATFPAQNIFPESVQLRAAINPNGAMTSVYFEFGTTTNYGDMTAAQDFGTGVTQQVAMATLAGLAPETSYEYRAVANNPFGTVFGNNVSFTTPAPARFTAARVAQGQFQFTLAGQPGRIYQVQISTNLLSWMVLTNVLLVNGSTNLADSAVLSSQRFYRAWLAP